MKHGQLEYEAVVFDMDGVIFDSENKVIECWKVIAEKYGIPNIEAACHKCLGLNREATREVMLSIYGKDFPYDEYKTESSALFHERYGQGRLPVKPYVEALMEFLKKKGKKIALASSTRSEVVRRELADAKLLPWFDEVICGDMVAHSKPAPDIFAKACQRLKVAPEKAIAIEDSYNGIRSASAAGLRPIMVPDLAQPNAEMRELAEAVLPSLGAVISYLKPVLVFDVDDTLYDQRIPFQNACREVMGERLDVEEERAYEAFMRRSQDMFRGCESGEVSLEDSRIYRIQNAMRDCGIEMSREKAESFQEVYLCQQKELRLSSEMREVLDYCKEQEIPMGIITNGPYEHQMWKITSMGLLDWIPEEAILVSGKEGVTKPDARIFSLAQERLGCTPDQTYMVGDNFSNDICGAKAAGWHTIWVDYRGREMPEGAEQPDFHVTSAEQLLRCIKSL